MSQNKASARRNLQSVLANKSAANQLIDALSVLQENWNTAMDELNATSGAPIAGVQEETEIQCVADVAGSLGGTYFEVSSVDTDYYAWINVDGGSVDPEVEGRTGIEVAISEDDVANDVAIAVASALDGVSNLADQATANTDTVTLIGASEGPAQNAPDAGDSGFTVSVSVPGVTPDAGLPTDFEAELELPGILSPDAAGQGQNRASLRAKLRSSLAHRKCANVVLDSLVELQVSFDGLLEKLDDQAGTLTDTDFEADLGVSEVDWDAEGSEAQHRASLRRTLISAMANKAMGNLIADGIGDLQEKMNGALAQLDTGTIEGDMEQYKVSAVDPDEAL